MNRAILAKGVAAIMVLFPQVAACSEFTIGGRTVESVFSDQRVAQLAQEACRGNKQAVALAAKRGANPNGRGIDGFTPLAWAVSCGNVEGVRALLEAGADPNLTVSDKVTPTYMAVLFGRPDVLKQILDHGGNPDAVDKNENTALGRSLDRGVSREEWDCYYLLLDAGANINFPNQHGSTIATSALALGRYDKVVELLKRGYDHDLPEIARLVDQQSAAVDGVSPEFGGQEISRQELISLLRSKGIFISG